MVYTHTHTQYNKVEIVFCFADCGFPPKECTVINDGKGRSAFSTRQSGVSNWHPRGLTGMETADHGAAKHVSALTWACA